MRNYLIAIVFVLLFSGCTKFHLHLNEEPGGQGLLVIPVTFENEAEGDYVYEYTLVGTGASALSIPLEPTDEQFIFQTIPAGEYTFEALAIGGRSDTGWNLNASNKVVPLSDGYTLNVYRNEVTLFTGHITIQRKAVGYGETFVSRWDVTSIAKTQQEAHKETISGMGKSTDGFVH